MEAGRRTSSQTELTAGSMHQLRCGFLHSAFMRLLPSYTSREASPDPDCRVADTGYLFTGRGKVRIRTFAIGDASAAMDVLANAADAAEPAVPSEFGQAFFFPLVRDPFRGALFRFGHFICVFVYLCLCLSVARRLASLVLLSAGAFLAARRGWRRARWCRRSAGGHSVCSTGYR